jgi:hypothetical protein
VDVLLMAALWHYTCEHGRARLGERGRLRPWVQPLLGYVELVWATTMATPDAEALGLTAVSLSCDRTAHRYHVLQPELFTPWATWWPGRVDPRVVSELSYPPKRPAAWWLATEHVAAEYAPIERTG